MAFAERMFWCRAGQRVVEANRPGEGFGSCDSDLVKGWQMQALGPCKGRGESADVRETSRNCLALD